MVSCKEVDSVRALVALLRWWQAKGA